VPQENAFDAGGKHYESLMWSYGDQLTSGSPAHSRAFSGDQRDPARMLVVG
jgi:hypothetical protein